MITRLKVSGFKNLVYVDIHLGPFTCIAGLNGVGKSNLFDAIRFLSSSASMTLVLGKWLTDSTGGALSGQIPALENCPPHNEDGTSAFHLYAPWWPYADQLAGKLGFARGYYMGWGGGRTMPGASVLIPSKTKYGSAMKEEARRYFGSVVSFHARGYAFGSTGNLHFRRSNVETTLRRSMNKVLERGKDMIAAQWALSAL